MMEARAGRAGQRGRMFKASVSKKSGGYLVDIDGRLDSETWAECEEQLKPVLDARPRVVTFDLADLDFISSMGIRTILKVRKAVEAHGGKVLLADMQPQIAKVFEITAALPKERIFASVEEADRYFTKIQERETGGEGHS